MKLPFTAPGLLLAFATSAFAQNHDHPGLVFVEKTGWLAPDAARAKGCFEYERRWFPADMRKKLDAWHLEDQKHATWESARSDRTSHYRVVSDVPRFILELEIEPFLDQLYETYVKVFREQYGLESSAANQKLVKVYASYREYRTHESDTSGPPPRENPAFIVNGQELVSFYDDTDPGEFYASVFHEGAHQFMSAVLPGAKFPLWIDEAMATYFEGCTWSRATKKVTVAFLPPDRLEHAKELLKDATPPAHGSLAEALFASVPEAQFQAKHYALSWSFIYYMLNRDGGKYRKNFALFLKAMNGAGTRPVGEIFKRATGMELVEMERGWRDAVLSWKAPPAPVWVRSEVTTPDPAVHFDAGDHVWSIDGIEVFDADSAKKAWEGRAKDRPCALLVVRRTKVAGPEQYTSSYVTLEVAASSPLKLEWRADQLRDCGLRD